MTMFYEHMFDIEKNYKNLIPETLVPRIEFMQTCSEFPEQYDMKFDGKKVGYFRLRGGDYTVSQTVNEHDPQIIYTGECEGDGFFFDFERDFFLTMGILSVLKYLGEIKTNRDIPVFMNMPKSSFSNENAIEVNLDSLYE